MKINFTNVKTYGTDFEPLEDGNYNARITKIESRESQAGSTYLQFEFTITDAVAKGRKVWDNYSLNEKALWKIAGLLSALGYEVDGELEFDPGELMGRELNITVGTEDYKDKLRNKVNDHRELQETAANGFDF